MVDRKQGECGLDAGLRDLCEFLELLQVMKAQFKRVSRLGAKARYAFSPSNSVRLRKWKFVRNAIRLAL